VWAAKDTWQLPESQWAGGLDILSCWQDFDGLGTLRIVGLQVLQEFFYTKFRKRCLLAVTSVDWPEHSFGENVQNTGYLQKCDGRSAPVCYWVFRPVQI
jgi:hypothetical protein